MAEESKEDKITATDPIITPHMRHYYLHREERNKKRLERYHNDPEVIARRQEREKKKAEKDAAVAAKRAEKEKRVQELTMKSEKTRRKINTISAAADQISE